MQYLLTYRIGRRLKEGYGKMALVTADTFEEAKEKLIKARTIKSIDAVSSWEDKPDNIINLNIE